MKWSPCLLCFFRFKFKGPKNGHITSWSCYLGIYDWWWNWFQNKENNISTNTDQTQAVWHCISRNYQEFPIAIKCLDARILSDVANICFLFEIFCTHVHKHYFIWCIHIATLTQSSTQRVHTHIVASTHKKPSKWIKTKHFPLASNASEKKEAKLLFTFALYAYFCFHVRTSEFRVSAHNSQKTLCQN